MSWQANLCLPSTDPERFKAAQAIRDMCKPLSGINCDVGLYLTTSGFDGLPDCWKMENYSQAARACAAGICNRCSKGSSNCYLCGGRSTNQAPMCADCSGGPMKGKCAVCKSAGSSGTAKICYDCRRKGNGGCAYCGKKA